jgi:D-beta-D-heptose 7-phosphate kinase/D-beta-D-heptose 1-phosphate adenosyltransferase
MENLQKNMNFDISVFERCKIIVIGDLMIDEYVWGNVDRVSPEAPVPVVSVERENYTLGGAGNVINNLVSLEAQVSVAGAIGTGINADLLLKTLADMELDTAGLIRVPNRPTTKKTRIIAANQQVLRIDRETTKPITEKAASHIYHFLEKHISECHAILFSDYGKGLLSTDLLKRLIDLANRYNKPTLCDPKGLSFKKYAGTFIITPNKKEASLAAGIEITDTDSLIAVGEKLLTNIPVKNVLITCGKDGMALFEQGNPPHMISAKTRQVYDVSGAGDTVLSVLGMAVAAGLPLAEAATLANTAAGIVVGKVGTAPIEKEELREAFNTAGKYTVPKRRNLATLTYLVNNLKAEGKRIVLTNGCFDLLHAGHIRLLGKAKEMGDVLIVALDTDESVRKLKGKGRPILAEKERVQIISALDSVDYVTVFSSDKLFELLKALRPDILIKGSNYTSEKVRGHEIVEQFGGRVALVPITEEISSTRIINQIKNR